MKLQTKAFREQAKKSSRSVNFITDLMLILPLIILILTGVQETIQANPTATISALALSILIKVSNITYHFYKSILETNIVIPDEPLKEDPVEDNETYDLK